jgi:hypothetical protein
MRAPGNVGLWMRTMCGVGTPRGLQGRVAALIALVLACWNRLTAQGPAVFGRPADRLADSESVGQWTPIAAFARK